MFATSNPKRTLTQSFACRGEHCCLPADFLWEARCAAVLSSCTRVYGTSGIRLTDRFLQVVEKGGDKKYFFLCFELFGFPDRRLGLFVSSWFLHNQRKIGECPGSNNVNYERMETNEILLKRTEGLQILTDDNMVTEWR